MKSETMQAIKSAAKKAQNDFKKYGTNENEFPKESARFEAYERGYKFAQSLHEFAYFASIGKWKEVEA